jgi:hypothetical protein
VSATAAPTESFSEALAEMSRRNVESTLTACDQFRRWHRENFVLRTPTTEQMLEHAQDIRLLLMSLRWLQATLADPGGPAQDILPRVEAMIRLLEDCWQNVHEPIDEEEARQLCTETFPE